MNLKLNNDVRNSSCLLSREPKSLKTIKEERQRTGRYIAILVGISLLCLAIYHAWVRKIPVVASLVVPALIMFIYVGWVLYTASRDKKRALALDAEAALNALQQETDETNDLEAAQIINTGSPQSSMKIDETFHKELVEISSVTFKGEKPKEQMILIRPLILVNDELPEGLDQSCSNIYIIDSRLKTEKVNEVLTTRRHKRRFGRSKKHAVFKRSYSIS